MRLLSGADAAARTMTWGEWRDESLSVAAALSADGVEHSRRVAILAHTGFTWPVADIGVLSAGLTSVGIYPTSSPSQIERQLSDCAARTVIVDDVSQLESIRSMRSRLPELREIVSACEMAGDDVTSWGSWIARGAAKLAGSSTRSSLERTARNLSWSSPALVIYTSGSTGEAKGAVLSHGCIEACTESIDDALEFRESDTTISYLPYSHAAERIFGLYTRIRCGMEAGVIADQSRLWDAITEYGPTVFGGLPRYFEKIFEKLRAEHEVLKGAERARWDRTIELGIALSRMRRAGLQPSMDQIEQWNTDGALPIERARSYLGGRARLITSGGATLPEEIAEYLDALGVTVLGAYGLTEHLCVAFNRPSDYRFDSVGKPMLGAEIRIAEDGEILVRRSERTFTCYLNRPEESRNAFTADGEWLLTGDLGSLDASGHLRIVGRKKELMALSNGKMVAPRPIEARLTEHPWIAQAVVHAEGRRFVSALIALRREIVEAWAHDRGIDGDYGKLVTHPLIVEKIQQAVDSVNASLSRPESIRRFVILDRELSIEASELTPTHKVRREKVLEKYSAELEALYR